MKTITLNRAIELLDRCTAVYLDDESLVFPQLNEDENDPVFLTLDSAAGGEETFVRNDHQSVRIDTDGRMVLMNTDGFTAKIMPLTCCPIYT